MEGVFISTQEVSWFTSFKEKLTEEVKPHFQFRASLRWPTRIVPNSIVYSGKMVSSLLIAITPPDFFESEIQVCPVALLA